MSAELATPLAPISVSTPLRVLFDRVDVRTNRLEEVLPSLDLTPDQLRDTHIHLGHKALLMDTKRIVNGQCVKILPDDATLEERREQAKYIEYLIPGLERDKVVATTFVALDLPAIAMEQSLQLGKAQEEKSNALFVAQEPDILDIERALCFVASKTLMHELLHVPHGLERAATHEEAVELRDNEEAFIEEKLQEIGQEGVPARLVNLKFRRELNTESLFLILAQISQHRGW